MRQTVVLHDGAAQWLGFDLDQPTVMIVSAYGALVGADPRLVLFAASGAVAGENDVIDQGQERHECAGGGGEACVELMSDEEPEQRGGAERDSASNAT